MQYSFRTTLIRDAAYESLLSTQRSVFHLKIAEYLESLSNPEILVGYFGILAHHYRGAKQPKKELFYTLQAAVQAERIYANAEALERYTRGLVLLDEMETHATDEEMRRAIYSQRFELLSGRSRIYGLMGDLSAWKTDTQALLPLAQQMADDPAWLVDAILQQPLRDREDFEKGLPLAREALAMARQMGDRKREMNCLIAIAQRSYGLKDPNWREIAERALDLARQLGDLHTEVSLLLGIGDAYGMDNLPRNLEYLEAALEKSEKLNDKAIEMALLAAIGPKFERSGDYYRHLTEYEQKRLRISREIGDRITEGQSLMFCGQIQAIYLGDYEAGLNLEMEALHHWEGMPDKLYPLLRVAQIQTALGRYDEALETIELARPVGDRVINELGRVGLVMVTAILNNALGDEVHVRMVLDLAAQIEKMIADNLISRHYLMVANCEATAANLRLAECLTDEEESQTHLHQALESSQKAVDIYKEFGFTQAVECISEEILYRHHLALNANGHEEEAFDYLEWAYAEMMRKYELIPADSIFRQTYLENIALHRDIRVAYLAEVASRQAISTKNLGNK
jgi:tetratricopeptide (TPR) repeat protein